MTPSGTMRAVSPVAAGGPEVLQVATVPVPSPGPGEVLVRVAAAGVNRIDTQQRQGLYPPAPGAGPVPGVEVAGRIAAVGPGVEGWRVGDAACALVSGGGYAEYCVAPAPQCLPWPDGYDAATTAALPQACFTVWLNLFDVARLQPGESLLVHGGTSGIGAAALQIARAFGAGPLYATAGSADKCAACLRFGADAAINHRQEDFAERVRGLTGGRGVDVVLDMVGAPYAARNLRCLAERGRLVMIGFLEGSKAPEFDFARIMLRQLTVTGSTLRPRPVAEKGRIAAALAERLWPLLNAGDCRPAIDSVLPLARAADAHARMESSQHIGKIVLTLE